MSGSNDLLLEIGTEEIPARFIPPALERMRQQAADLFEGGGLAYGELAVYGTPRRLVLHVKGLEENQAERVRETLGPPRKISFDPKGLPTPAALGFAKAQGVEVGALQINTTEKGEYLCVVKREAGRPTREVLSMLLPDYLSQITFPKSMRWKPDRVRFARPIRWILCLYGNTVIPFSFAGVESGSLSRGHRFLAPESFEVKNSDAYFHDLETRFVMIDPVKRRTLILEELDREAGGKKGNAVRDESLLEEVCFLVEYPVAVCGDFDPSFLKLPREVLMTSMRGHQKYFPLENAGGLLPFFVGISNLRSRDMETIRKGYERVLKARLSDARFFFDTDRKLRLDDRVEKLKQVVFLDKLGTLWDKVHRLVPLVRSVCGEWGWEDTLPNAERAALLCKSDLLTEMVGEFPELQGVMGREYALHQGEPPAVAQAIDEHYLPRFSGDRLPLSREGCVLAVADKIDNLVGCFSLGLIPTGSYDPYALRRQALGVLNILISQKSRTSLTALFRAGLAVYGSGIRAENHDLILEKIIPFVRERAEGLFQGDGHLYDTIRTVVLYEKDGIRGFDDPYSAALKIAALEKVRKEAEFEMLMVSYKRAINILRSSQGGEGVVEETLLRFPEEKRLFHALSDIEGRFTVAMDGFDYEVALKTLATLKEPVDQFFDTVLVMDPDPDLRANRHRLLSRIQTLFSRFGDFSQIVVEGKR
jgi:glycyl-tRNA synthetase beta chain